jgi:hypothetical protein
MNSYRNFTPTNFDSNIDIDRAAWLVVPVGQNRDSGSFDQSNFETALAMLGGESETVEVHRFGHWANGWFEIIIVKPNSKSETIGNEIETSLEDYPLLDDDDHSEREWNAACEGWDNWGRAEEIENLGDELGLENTDAIENVQWEHETIGDDEFRYKIVEYELNWEHVLDCLNSRSLRGEIDRFGPEMRLYWDSNNATETEIVNALNSVA